jgi:hypothetical protein
MAQLVSALWRAQPLLTHSSHSENFDFLARTLVRNDVADASKQIGQCEHETAAIVGSLRFRFSYLAIGSLAIDLSKTLLAI